MRFKCANEKLHVHAILGLGKKKARLATGWQRLAAEVVFLNLAGNAFDIVRQEVNIITDEVRRRGVARHDLSEDFLCAAIKKDIVARTAFAKVIHDVMDADLNEIRQRIKRTARLHDDIKFAEAHTRTIRYI